MTMPGLILQKGPTSSCLLFSNKSSQHGAHDADLRCLVHSQSQVHVPQGKGSHAAHRLQDFTAPWHGYFGPGAPGFWKPAVDSQKLDGRPTALSVNIRHKIWDTKFGKSRKLNGTQYNNSQFFMNSRHIFIKIGPKHEAFEIDNVRHRKYLRTFQESSPNVLTNFFWTSEVRAVQSCKVCKICRSSNWVLVATCKHRPTQPRTSLLKVLKTWRTCGGQC